ncbi:hypothetical protein ACFL47_10430 [Candidatus Latescibacterota bacterium]
MPENRRSFIKGVSLGALGSSMIGCTEADTKDAMKAGFSKVKVTPPVGTAMTGFGFRDYDPGGCRGIHDDLFARGLYLEQGEEKALILGFDLLFFSRDEADRFKGAIGRRIDLSPKEIFLNTSHTHTGPKVGTWDYSGSDRLYLQFLEDAIVETAIIARNAARDVTLRAGNAHTELPYNRRLPLPDGVIDFAPNPDGATYKKAPFCLFEDMNGKAVCFLFSASCHPSTIKGNDRTYQVSADYPGVAMNMLDEHFGATCSLFLQGAAGDTKSTIIGKGERYFRSGDWPDVEKSGALLANDIKKAIAGGYTAIEPDLKSAMVEMDFPLQQSRTREEFVEVTIKPPAHSESIPEGMKRWALEKIELIDRGLGLPTSVPMTAHGIQLGKGLRLVGVEAEIVAELGDLIENSYSDGITFPMGYTDGAQMYLPTTKMIDEGGYEVESYYEYRHPSGLAKGIDGILAQGVKDLQDNGIL